MSADNAEVKDVVLIGLGITGVYQLYRLAEAGFDVQALEAGAGVGGTWYWNNYPGCRFDSESYSYGYFFDNDLFDDWEWTELYASQPEIERYINHVVDRFDLRKHIRLNARVASISFDDETGLWTTVTEAGDTWKSKFVVTALGLLSAPYIPDFPGLRDYNGIMHHSGLWPKEGVDVKGKRVAIVGSAASAVQTAPIWAREAAQVTILQRTPNWCGPLNNRPVTEAEKEAHKGARLRIYNELQDLYGGFWHKGLKIGTFDVSEKERQAHWDYLYDKCSGLSNYTANFADISTNLEANKQYCDYLARRIRERVEDPVVADKLIPKDHGIGEKRPPMETKYYEIFNQDNVALVDLKEEPIVRFSETGIELPGRSLDFEVIMLATGFDAFSGAWNRIDIRGAGGVPLKQVWENGPQNYLGTFVKGFPNFLMVGGPHAAHGNVFRVTQHQVDFVMRLLKDMRENGWKKVDVGQETMDKWVEGVEQRARGKLGYGKSNYANGANIPGKPRMYLTFHAASAGDYGRTIHAAAGDDGSYPELVIEK